MPGENLCKQLHASDIQNTVRQLITTIPIRTDTETLFSTAHTKMLDMTQDILAGSVPSLRQKWYIKIDADQTATSNNLIKLRIREIAHM